MMHKKSLVFFTLLLFVSSCFAQTVTHNYADSTMHCKYQTTLAMLNGEYASFYKNGVLKSRGFFQYNNRIGEWSLWDSTGNLKVKRNYTNPYEYRRITPPIPAEGPIPLLSKPIYTLERDSLGEWKNFFLAQRMCAYQQRNFKCIYTSQKQLFFNCGTLFDIIYTNAEKKNCSIYGTKDGNEDNTYSVKLDIADIDTSKFTLVGFRVKSDWIFDNSRLLSDERPLFITPLVVYNANPNDTVDLFSVYVPAIRKYLVQFQLAQTVLPPYLHNLDDVFFFGCFGVDKWRTNNVYDRGTKGTYVYTAPNAINKDLLKEVETENDLWLHFNK